MNEHFRRALVSNHPVSADAPCTVHFNGNKPVSCIITGEMLVTRPQTESVIL